MALNPKKREQVEEILDRRLNSERTFAVDFAFIIDLLSLREPPIDRVVQQAWLASPPQLGPREDFCANRLAEIMQEPLSQPRENYVMSLFINFPDLITVGLQNLLG